jgi:MFS family permease
VVSTTGTEMTAVALPWFVLVTTGSPGRMAAVMAAEFLGIALCGVPSGQLATALGPRRTMLTADLSRAVLIGLVPVLHAVDLLSLPVLLLIAFVIGGFFPAYTSSQRLLMAGLVDDDERRLTRVSGLFGSVNETASFVGPALGGVLVAIFGPPTVLLVDAASYLVAFTLVALAVPGLATPPAAEEDTGVLAGVRYLVRDRPLWRRILAVSVQGIGWTAMIATLPVLALTEYGGGATLAGWFVAAYGAGSVCGGLISARATAVGERSAAAACAGIAISTWLLLVGSQWTVLAAVALNGVCSGLFYPRFFATLTVRTPPALRAKVMTTVNAVLSAAGPIGFVAAGLLLESTASATPTIVLTIAATGAGAVLFAATLRRRERVEPFSRELS